MAPYIDGLFKRDEHSRPFKMILAAHKWSEDSLAFLLTEYNKVTDDHEIISARSLYFSLLENPFIVKFWIEEHNRCELIERLVHVYQKLYQISPKWHPGPGFNPTLDENGIVAESFTDTLIRRAREQTRHQVCTNKAGAVFLKMFATRIKIDDYSYLSEPT